MARATPTALKVDIIIARHHQRIQRMLIPVLQIYFMLLVWRSGNGIRHSNEVKLR